MWIRLCTRAGTSRLRLLHRYLATSRVTSLLLLITWKCVDKEIVMVSAISISLRDFNLLSRERLIGESRSLCVVRFIADTARVREIRLRFSEQTTATGGRSREFRLSRSTGDLQCLKFRRRSRTEGKECFTDNSVPRARAEIANRIVER